MTEPDATKSTIAQPTKLVTIAGREMMVKGITDAQFMQLSHEAAVVGSDKLPGARQAKALDRVFRIIKSAIVEDDDKEYVEDQIADGNLTMPVLVKVLRELYDDITTGAAPKARRARSTRQK